uniref:Uncharacterized protein n=1 Tax=Anguilla anguilla TaxID=7936 RepID=A0A0E9TMR5_ANGAN
MSRRWIRAGHTSRISYSTI